MWQLMVIPKEDFADYLEKGKEHCNKCVRVQVDYFERDKGTIALGRIFLLILNS